MKCKQNIYQINFIGTILMFLVISGCQNHIKSHIEFDNKNINLSTYNLFSWPDNKPMIKSVNHINLKVSNQIKDSVLKTLEAKGYQYTLNSTSADFIVSYALSSTNEKTFEPASTLEIDNEKCHHPLSHSYSLPALSENDDLQTIMMLSIFDVDKCVVVWQARIHTLFNPHEQERNQINEIRTTVTEILSQFPLKK